MSAENDVPLGEGPQRYYERQFGERIRQIDKGGTSRQPNNAGSNGNGRFGCGVLIAVFLLIRIVTTFLNSHSHTTGFSSSPPVPPPFKVQQPIIIDHPRIDVRDEDEGRLLERLLKERAEEEKPLIIPPENRVPQGTKH